MNTVLSKLSLITHIKEGEDVAEKIAVFLSTSRAGAFVSFRQRGFSLYTRSLTFILTEF